jgi:hypothetical protein
MGVSVSTYGVAILPAFFDPALQARNNYTSNFCCFSRTLPTPGKIGSAVAIFKRRSNRALNAGGFGLQLKRMAQQQGGGKDCAEGIRDSFPRNVRG